MKASKATSHFIKFFYDENFKNVEEGNQRDLWEAIRPDFIT
jgi:hypothetical protein